MPADRPGEVGHRPQPLGSPVVAPQLAELLAHPRWTQESYRTGPEGHGPAGPGGPRLHSPRPEHQVDCRYHLRAHRPGMALPGGGDGSVPPPHRGLGDGPSQARRSGLRPREKTVQQSANLFGYRAQPLPRSLGEGCLTVPGTEAENHGYETMKVAYSATECAPDWRAW